MGLGRFSLSGDLARVWGYSVGRVESCFLSQGSLQKKNSRAEPQIRANGKPHLWIGLRPPGMGSQICGLLVHYREASFENGAQAEGHIACLCPSWHSSIGVASWALAGFSYSEGLTLTPMPTVRVLAMGEEEFCFLRQISPCAGI